MEWGVEEARGRFAELIESALTQGPQVVMRGGESAVIVLSATDYHRLRSGRTSLVDDLLAGPLWDAEFASGVSRREKSPGRDVPI